MALENNFIHAKKVDWLEFIILSKLKEYSDYRSELESRKRFNPSTWALFSAAIAILIAINRNSPNDMAFSLLMFMGGFFFFYLAVAPFFEWLFGKFYRFIKGASYTAWFDDERTKQISLKFKRNTSNQIYLANSILTQIGSTSDISFKTLQFYEIFDLLNDIFDSLNEVNIIGQSKIFADSLPKARVNAVIESCGSILDRMKDIAHKESKVHDILISDLKAIDRRWGAVSKNIS